MHSMETKTNNWHMVVKIGMEVVATIDIQLPVGKFPFFRAKPILTAISSDTDAYIDCYLNNTFKLRVFND